MSEQKSYQVPGKFIIAGEHTVLRGGRAVGISCAQYSLELCAQKSSEFQFLPHQSSLRKAMQGVFKQYPILQQYPHLFEVKHNLPMGAGLGFSAALSVACAKWAADCLDLDEQQMEALAQEIEHLFHGKSSGLDIALVLRKGAVLFQKYHQSERLEGVFPCFQLIDSGLRAQTKACIEHVETFWKKDQDRAFALDRAMDHAAEICWQGLSEWGNGSHRQALRLLASGMDQAHQCFLEWGLVSQEVIQQLEALKAKGALSARLTGSGLGGMILALFPGASENEPLK